MSREVILELIGIAGGMLIIIFRKHFRNMTHRAILWKAPPASPFEQGFLTAIGLFIIFWGFYELLR
ncbi:MAG TPA: hypothetical protein VD969_20030 [Symbiobacteriaceae bacterium]|nr:hypothetical protein [Symbiobacteriaceae bacterium]